MSTTTIGGGGSAGKVPVEKDWEFLLSCLKHTAAKPDFEAVAKELGMKNQMAAYKRHWTILNKLGLTGKGSSASNDNSTTTTPASNKKSTLATGGAQKKRGRPKKIEVKAEDIEDKKQKIKEEEIREDVEKEEEEGEAESDVETPAKKVKVEDGDVDVDGEESGTDEDA